MRVGIVVPHMFMHRDILPKVIFSPAYLALDLANGLQNLGVDTTLLTPGPITTNARNIRADLRLFDAELAGRGYDYVTLLKKHPVVYLGMARQVQAELLAKAFRMANNNELDIVHVYTNEEELGVVFAEFCKKPVVFTHHDPFNLLVKYKSIYPKYSHLPWISTSHAQRADMPADTNWVANIYHGLTASLYTPSVKPTGGYVANLGRIIESKGVHVAIAAVKQYNQTHSRKLALRIAGKHYGDQAKDTYWAEKIAPLIDGTEIIYDGFIDSVAAKEQFLGNAEALLVPSIFEEPFGMVTIEALACGTPVIGLDSGAIPEIIATSNIGRVAHKVHTADGAVDTAATAKNIAESLGDMRTFDRRACRLAFEKRFTTERMVRDHVDTYTKLCS